MNKKVAVLSVLLLILPGYGSAEYLTVITEKAPIRVRPSFVSKIVGNAWYKNSVFVLLKQGAWRKVEFGPYEGWVHVLSLVQSDRAFSAGATIDHRVSSSEISLAGKGFNSDVEQAYQQQHGDAGYEWLNRMEKINVSSNDLEQFASNSKFVIKSAR